MTYTQFIQITHATNRHTHTQCWGSTGIAYSIPASWKEKTLHTAHLHRWVDSSLQQLLFYSQLEQNWSLSVSSLPVIWLHFSYRLVWQGTLLGSLPQGRFTWGQSGGGVEAKVGGSNKYRTELLCLSCVYSQPHSRWDLCIGFATQVLSALYACKHFLIDYCGCVIADGCRHTTDTLCLLWAAHALVCAGMHTVQWRA